MRTRLDVFLHGLLHQSYPELWAFCRKLLLLSHGQATVERGFSVNKEVEADNMKEDTVVAQRVICDYISVCGGVLKVPLTKELLAAAASATSQYRLHLDQEKRKHASNAQREKRKGAEDHLEQLKTKKKILIEVANSLVKDADKLAEQAEGKSDTLMAQLSPSRTSSEEDTKKNSQNSKRLRKSWKINRQNSGICHNVKLGITSSLPSFFTVSSVYVHLCTCTLL